MKRWLPVSAQHDQIPSSNNAPAMFSTNCTHTCYTKSVGQKIGSNLMCLEFVSQVEAMVAMVLADQLLIHYAQCELLPRDATATGDADVVKQFAHLG